MSNPFGPTKCKSCYLSDSNDIEILDPYNMMDDLKWILGYPML